MNIAVVYQYIYIIIVAFLTFNHLNRYRMSGVASSRNTASAEVTLLLAVILFIGLRPVDLNFYDMTAAVYILNTWQGKIFDFDWDVDNKIFDNIMSWWGCNGFDHNLFFLCIAIIYFVSAYIGIKRLFRNHTMLAYLVFLAAFSTFSYGTNGIKAGAASSIFIMALSYWGKPLVCIPLMLTSLGFHHSMIMPIAACVVVFFFKNPKWFYYGWFACFLLAAFHVQYFQILFGGMADEQGSGYLMATEKTTDAHIGFRPDFVLYSAAPVWIGYRFEMKKKMVLSKSYSILMHFYLTANAVWMLCMYASYNNRIAYLSWFVYPIVLIYPFLDPKNNDSNRFVKLAKVVLYHLYFTLFMEFVYYGLLSLGH